MEAVVGVVLVISVFVVVYLRKLNIRKRDAIYSEVTARDLDIDSKSGPAPDQSGRFDERSARHLRHARIVTGPAWITDGDTLTISNTQIRLFGIDAPELDHPYGKKAKWALHGLCKGHVVRAEITDEDKYGRTVARCFLPDGRDLSAEMVKQGLALDWPKFSGGAYRSLEPLGVRKKLFLADARQKGRMHVWEQHEERRAKH